MMMLHRVEKLNCDKGTKLVKDEFNCAEDKLNVESGTKFANEVFRKSVDTPFNEDKLIMLDRVEKLN